MIPKISYRGENRCLYDGPGSKCCCGDGLNSSLLKFAKKAIGFAAPIILENVFGSKKLQTVGFAFGILRKLSNIVVL